MTTATKRAPGTNLGKLANALCENVLSTPSDQLLAEVAEDHGDSAALAKEFDRVLNKEQPQS